MPLPLGHQTWFEDPVNQADWGFAGETETLLLLGAALLLTLLVRAASTRWNGVDVPVLARMAPYMPFAVRVHLAMCLLGLLALGVYLSPAMDLHWDLAGILLGVVMALVLIGMATGYRTSAAALLLIAAGPIGMLEFGVSPVLQRIDVLGLALFIFFAGPGRWSADLDRGAASEPDDDRIATAIWCLRVFAGIALIIVAFREKLAYPEYAVHFLAENPDLELSEQLGLGWSTETFVRVAGSIEVLFGLLLISGAMPQVIVLIAGIPFNATLYFFGESELFGHLPIYGAMLVLLVYGSHPRYRPMVKRILPARLASAVPS
ncbi:MAG TPA: hypothetical protein VD790_01260 [Thermoleophilaceae bacterium]|nr:hypothetical protein [Thermoleophilaceae bacterium]